MKKLSFAKLEQEFAETLLIGKDVLQEIKGGYETTSPPKTDCYFKSYNSVYHNLYGGNIDPHGYYGQTYSVPSGGIPVGDLDCANSYLGNKYNMTSSTYSPANFSTLYPGSLNQKE
ncbi:MAG: hypothetical protein QM727_04405 [Niabella sp.]